MAKAQDNYYFKKSADLLEALHLCRSPNSGRFPRQIIALLNNAKSDFRWAVPKKFLKNFDHFAKQHGWHYQSNGSHGEPTYVDTSALLNRQWCYRDPFIKNTKSYNGDSSTYYDPSNPQTEYIIGAYDQAQAQTILNKLVRFRCSNIKPVPVKLDGSQTFKYFWVISGEPIPYMILQSAPRAWWGPIIFGDTWLYKEWPHDLDVDDDILQQIDWGGEDKTEIVLLSRAEPEVLTLIADKSTEFKQFPLLPQVVDLNIGKVAQYALTAENVIAQPAPFNVQLSLVSNRNKTPHAQEILRLKEEVKLKLARIEDLDRLCDDDLLDLEPPEPLLMFFDQSDQGNSIPPEIRRLLIEWSDQTERLPQVLYQHIETDKLMPGETQGKLRSVHLVVLKSAIEHPSYHKSFLSGRMLGLELLAYCNTEFRYVRLPEWAQFGLNLFVPYGKWLQLYPELVPTLVGAQKLKKALKLDNASESQSVIFYSGAAGELTAYIIENSFDPIAGAIDWQCRVEVNQMKGSETAVALNTVDDFNSAVEREFSHSLNHEASARLGEVKQKLANELKIHRTEVDDKTAKLATLKEQLQNMEGTLGQLNAHLNELPIAYSELSTSLLSNVLNKADIAVAKIKPLEFTLKDIRSIEQEIAKIVSKINELIREIKKMLES